MILIISLVLLNLFPAHLFHFQILQRELLVWDVLLGLMLYPQVILLVDLHLKLMTFEHAWGRNLLLTQFWYLLLWGCKFCSCSSDLQLAQYSIQLCHGWTRLVGLPVHHKLLQGILVDPK